MKKIKLRKFMFASSFHNNVGYFFKINCFTPGHSLLIKIGFRIILWGYSVMPHRPQEEFLGDGVIKIYVMILILMPTRIFQIMWKEINLVWWSANISCFFNFCTNCLWWSFIECFFNFRSDRWTKLWQRQKT